MNEEALVRLKLAYGFPRQAIQEVLRLGGVRASEIDLVAAATRNNHFYDGIKAWDGWFNRDKGLARGSVFQLAGSLAGLIAVPGAEQLYYKSRTPIFLRRRSAIRRILVDELEIAAPLEFVDHHLAHCASAYFTSGFDRALVVSMDGGGDGASSHVYRVDDGSFEEVGSTSAFHSLGNYYSYVTEACGFKAQKHEGKITGLAAHGRPKHLDTLNSLITFRGGRIENVGRRVFSGALRALLDRLPDDWTTEDLSASIQLHCENIVSQYVEHHLDGEGSIDLALAGGLFANVRINQRLADLPGISRIFVHPGMSDGGLAVGAALVPCIRNRTGPRMEFNQSVLDHVYFGPGYSDGEIEQALGAGDLEFSKPASIEAEVAGLLAAGYVVARFAGRMEYGPRALGNRSILYHAADPSVNDWLNELLHRTEFMPFAPATLMEHADDYYLRIGSCRDAARFMTITLDCTERMKDHCGGAVHIDGTARPQLVREHDNPGYFRILDHFHRLTGTPTIINTSFNMHEEPIVCSPSDAVRAFVLGHLDYLAIGDYIARSPTAPQHPVVGLLEHSQSGRPAY